MSRVSAPMLPGFRDVGCNLELRAKIKNPPSLVCFLSQGVLSQQRAKMQLVPLVCAPTMLAGEAQTKGCPILDLNTNKASSLFSYGSCVTVMVSWLTHLYRYVLACPMPRSTCAEVPACLYMCRCMLVTGARDNYTGSLHNKARTGLLPLENALWLHCPSPQTNPLQTGS